MIITVKPAPGRVLHDPGNFMRPISETGSPVEDNAYWRRRIGDGDAIAVSEPTPARQELATPPLREGIGEVTPAAALPATDTPHREI